jgi:hypothetical protein
MTITLIAPAVGTYNPFTEVTTENEASIVLGFGGYTLEVPKGQVLSYSETDLNGRLGYELSIKCNRNGGLDVDLADESTFRLIQGADA